MSDVIKRMIEQNRINDHEVKRFALTVLLPLVIIIIVICSLCYAVGCKDGYKEGYEKGSLAGARYTNEEWTKEFKNIKFPEIK